MSNSRTTSPERRAENPFFFLQEICSVHFAYRVALTQGLDPSACLGGKRGFCTSHLKSETSQNFGSQAASQFIVASPLKP